MSYCNGCRHLYSPPSPGGDHLCGKRGSVSFPQKIYFCGSEKPSWCPGRDEKPPSDQDRIKALEEKVGRLQELFFIQDRVNKELRANHVSLINQLNKVLGR